jgi:hypothetical protein
MVVFRPNPFPSGLSIAPTAAPPMRTTWLAQAVGTASLLPYLIDDSSPAA